MLWLVLFYGEKMRIHYIKCECIRVGNGYCEDKRGVRVKGCGYYVDEQEIKRGE